MEQWLAENWFDVLSTVGIIGSLWIAIITLRSDAKAKRTSNLIALTANYIEIRKEHAHNPKLIRVDDPAADVEKQPVTPAEESFVCLAINHASSAYETLKDDLLVKQEGQRLDLKSFFSLLVPNAVWTKVKTLQNPDFAAFTDSSLKES
ncbi:MAG: hypothetical protein P4M11_09980 [Candidatus Pacebacteria bacterium]|nr:hypothetical protein [Candidatus Paceibacterota bacterium]